MIIRSGLSSCATRLSQTCGVIATLVGDVNERLGVIAHDVGDRSTDLGHGDPVYPVREVRRMSFW